MSRDRPRFSDRRGPPQVGGRVLAMGALLLVAAALLWARSAWWSRVAALPPVVVEVQGRVPAPGLVTVPGPARAHDAIRAAGGDPTGMVDATIEPGTRVVVGEGGWRAETMDQVLVIGLPVDVNTASAVALEAIPGVGAARARAIVDERARGGPYRDVEDLDRVPGIGPATVEALRPFVVASSAP
ncbi:helix-hairpin-helix domain-containing protein [Myxococcota bacterium]|nr:helix-hairpin-helix domain-containing protein [Myxococcota bacterium]